MNQLLDTYKGYKVIKVLGHGTFATVSMVIRVCDDKLFALKSIQTKKMDQKQLDCALNEVRLLSSIDVPNVIKYEGTHFNELTGQLGIIMEYADGGDLEQTIRDSLDLGLVNGFQQQFVWKVAFEVLRGLKKLHEHKIIHRDIKTANIFFVNGVAKLGDLNVSKVIQQDMCTTLTGTPYYMSPQIWKGEEYNQKCDIWALGCVLYEMCTFEPPFKANDFPSLFTRVIKADYSEISWMYTDKMKSFISKCLNPDPSFRPNARDLLKISFLKTDQFPENQGLINLKAPIIFPQKLNRMHIRMDTNIDGGKQAKKIVRFGSCVQIEQQYKPQKSKSRKRLHGKVPSIGYSDDLLPQIKPQAHDRKQFRIKTEKKIVLPNKSQSTIHKIPKQETSFNHSNLKKSQSNNQNNRSHIRPKSTIKKV